jgi:hypothetical protein
MSSWMQRKLGGVNRQNLTVFKGLDVGLIAESGLQKQLAFFHAQVRITAQPCVVCMCMGDYSTFDGTPGINIKFAASAVKTAGCKL